MVFLMWYMINRHGIHTVAYNKMKILWTHEINLGNVQNHTLYNTRCLYKYKNTIFFWNFKICYLDLSHEYEISHKYKLMIILCD